MTAGKRRAHGANKAPHLQREEGERRRTELLERLTKVAPAAPAWRCAWALNSCHDESQHRPHADLLGILESKRALKRSILEDLLENTGDMNEGLSSLLLRREEVGGVHRERIIRKITSKEGWQAVLETVRTTNELHILAKKTPPDLDTARLLMAALGDDRVAAVEQLMVARDPVAHARVYPYVQGAEEKLTEERVSIVLEAGGEVVKVADHLLSRPCPSGQWSARLLVGTAKKALRKLPEGERRVVAMEILLGLVGNWDGSIKDLVEACEALS